MRRQLLTTLWFTTLSIVSYAATFMQVKTTDGKIVKYDVEGVKEVTFVTDTTSSDHAYVDLGLPSGTLWATCNIGATKPEEFGDYFAWGETETKEIYNWSTYKHCISRDGYLYSLTKYNSGHYDIPGIIDSLSTLLPEDDAATFNWGNDWRMPTNDEQRELIEECELSWTEVNGVYGAKFTGKNGNSVFFPAAGLRYGSDVYGVDTYGSYWSSSCDEDEDSAPLLYISIKIYQAEKSRYYGFPVRAVRSQK